MPFVIIQLIAIVCVAALPAIATWLPDRLLVLDVPRKLKAYE